MRVRATDTAGNVQAPLTRAFSVDTVGPDTSITAQPNDPTERDGRELLLHGRPARLDLRLQARRRLVRSLRVAEELRGPRRRLAHLPGARDRPGRQPGPDAGELHLDDRPDRSELHGHPPDRHPLQRRRLARLQRNRGGHRRGSDRPRSRSRSSASRTTSSGTARLSRTEARTGARQPVEHRGRWRSPRRTSPPTGLRRAPPGGRHRGERRGSCPAHLHDRQRRAEHDVHVPPPSLTNSTDVGFDFDASEAGSSFECRIDGGSWAACNTPKSYTGLSQGSHTFEVRATDLAGNTDATPASFAGRSTRRPRRARSASPRPAGSTTRRVERSGRNRVRGRRGALDKVEISIRRSSTGDYWNGTAFADATENWRPATGTATWSHVFAAVSFPADDDFVVRARATDTAGNVETPLSYSFTYDTAAPQTTIDSSPADPTSATGASFSFSSSEGGTFECALDGGAFAACTSPKSYTGLAEGSHTFQVRATDAAANTDPTPASFTWTVDTSAPNTTITAQPSDPTSATSADFSFSSTEGSSTFECRIDGGAFAPAPRRRATPAWPTASHTFQVRATDAAGNTDATPATRSPGRSTPPRRTPRSPRSRATRATRRPPTSRFSSTEGGSTFECQLDGGGWSSCASPKSYTGLRRRPHTFEVRATDAAGNTDPTPASFTWTIDTAAPNTTITAQPSDPTNATGASFSFTSSEGGSTFECQLDGGGWPPARSPKTYTGLADGSHTFAGPRHRRRRQHRPDARELHLDDRHRRAEHDDHRAAERPENSRGRSLLVQLVEGGSTFECQLDGGGWAACTSPKSYTGLARARTPSRSAPPTPPATPTRPPRASPGRSTRPRRTPRSPRSPSDPSNSASRRLLVQLHRGRLDLRVPARRRRLVLLQLARRATPASATARHTFEVRATDAAGNTDPTPASSPGRSTRPRRTPRSPRSPSDPCNSAAADFTFSATEGGSTFECQLDGGGWSSCSSPKSYTGLSRRLAHLRGARDRRRRQHRPDARELHLDDRHRRAELVHELPGEHRLVQHRRLERRLLAERHLRHGLRRRLGPRPRRGVDPAQRRQPLLERLVLRERVRGLAERRRRLVEPRLRRRRVPGRRQLHDPRPRTRPRRQPRGAREPHLHDRHHARPTRRSTPVPRTRRTARIRASPSPAAPAASASSAASTAARGAPACRRRATRGSQPARTPSRRARRTAPGTSTRRLRRRPGRST